jgi:hypothetical protein
MRGDYDPFEAAAERRLSVSVLNESFSAVNVTIVASGRRTFLGRAEGNARSGFSIPWSGESEVRFFLEVFGGQRYTTAPVAVVAGRPLEVVIREPLQRSVVRR